MQIREGADGMARAGQGRHVSFVQKICHLLMASEHVPMMAVTRDACTVTQHSLDNVTGVGEGPLGGNTSLIGI